MVAPEEETGKPEVLDRLLSRVLRESDAYGGGIYVLTSSGQVLSAVVLAGVPSSLAMPWARVGISASGPLAEAVREGRLVWVGAEGELARRYPRIGLALPYSFALAAAPAVSAQRTWGGLVLLWPGSHPLVIERERQRAIEKASGYVGAALRRAEESGHPILPTPEPRIVPVPRRRMVTQAESLAAVDFTERLPEGCCALDLDGRITFITPTGAELVGSTVPVLLGTRPWEVLPWLDDPVFEDRYRSAVMSRRPTSFTARRPDDLWLSFEFYPDARGISVRIARSRLGEAGAAGGAGTGAETGGGAGAGAGAGSGAALRPLPDSAVVPATGAAPTRAGVLYQLAHLAAALTEALSVPDVIKLVVDQIAPSFGAHAVALFAVQSGKLRLRGHHGYGAREMERFDGVPLSPDHPSGRAVTTAEPAFFASRRELHDAFPRALVDDGNHAWAFLPLVAAGRPIGCCVLAYDRPHVFGHDQRALLTAFGGLAAQALDRAHLYDTKSGLARSLQASLLPQELPALPGLQATARYLPATRGMDIGGDFYDLVRLDDTTAGAVMGDVQGHSVTAAALMGQVRTAVRAHAIAGAAPDDVLARTNRLLTDLNPGLFTSCLYVQIDLARRRACLATAGHLPPLLRHPGGRAESVAMPPGLLLGIDPSAAYEAIEIDLPPGAVLALFTDGLVERPGTDIEDATADLADALGDGEHSLDALADALMRRALPTADRTDDTALFLLRLAPS
ncbi:SpoIIE family protein phosphatase [Streptomyces flavidovirens]|uniref:SpoIIE family protein phosphatase n=1 Tax=Streptomyces flavidovirens TaxID=67298 RepID=UPI0036B31DAA